MNSIQPLLNLLAQAERERDELAAACQRAAQAKQTASAQAAQLLTYRSEYETRWTTQFRTDGRMELVNCYQGFMTRLSVAVEQQQRAQSHADECHQQALLQWREAETRVASVRRLIERRSNDARLAGERMDQKQSDEFAARAAWNRGTDTRPARFA